MLVLPKKELMRRHVEAREGMEQVFNRELERIMNANSDLDTYWILGKIRVENKGGTSICRPFLQACKEKPGLVKDSFVYEVDNKRGVKTLLWILHPDGSMQLPTLEKTISVAGK